MAESPRKFVNPNSYPVHLPRDRGVAGGDELIFPFEEYENQRTRRTDRVYFVEGDYWQRYANTGQLRPFRPTPVAQAPAVAAPPVIPPAPVVPAAPAPPAAHARDDRSGDAAGDSVPAGALPSAGGEPVAPGEDPAESGNDEEQPKTATHKPKPAHAKPKGK